MGRTNELKTALYVQKTRLCGQTISHFIVLLAVCLVPYTLLHAQRHGLYYYLHAYTQ